MSEPKGLLDFLGRVIRLSEETGLSFEEAEARLNQQGQELDYRNIVWLDFPYASTMVH